MTQRLEERLFQWFPYMALLDEQAGITIAPSGRHFKLVKRKLAKFADCRGLVRESNRTTFIERSTSGSLVLDDSIESNQATTVLNFQV